MIDILPLPAAFLYYSLLSIISYLFSKGDCRYEPGQRHFDEILEICSPDEDIRFVPENRQR